MPVASQAIDQNDTFTITIGTGNYDQADGKFSGGDSTIDINGNITVSAGTFTSTSGTMTVSSNLDFNSGITFSANSGTITFDGTAYGKTMACGNKTFNVIDFAKGGENRDITIGADCTLPLGNDPSTVGTLVNNGTINVGTGTWTHTGGITNNSTIATTLTTLDLEGTIYGNLIINTGSSLTMNGTTLNVQGSFTYNDGTIPANLDLTMDSNSFGAVSMTCNSYAFNSVNFNKTQEQTNITIGADCTIPLGNNPTTLGTLINNGTINAGTGTWTHTGGITNNSTISTTLTTLDLNDGSYGNLVINAGSNLTMSGTTLNIEGDFTYNDGTIPANLDLTMNSPTNGAAVSMTCNSYTFNTVVFDKGREDAQITIGADCTIPLGDDPTTGGTIINNGTINVGTGTWTTNGGITNNSTISTSLTTLDLNDGSYGNLVINADSSLTMIGTTLNIEGDFVYTAGTIPSNFDTTFNGTVDTDITCGGYAFGDVTISKTNGSDDLTAQDNCTMSGLTLTSGFIGNPPSAYTWTVNGDFTETPNTTFGGANLTVSFEGGAAQTLSKAAGTFASVFQVNKSGNELSLSTDFATSSETCTVVEGTFDINGKDFTCGSTFTVQDGGNLQLQGGETTTAPTLSAGSTVTYTGDGDAAADNYTLKNWTYQTLSINSTDGTTDTFGAADSLGTGLVNYWKFDEGAADGCAGGEDACDSAGSSHGTWAGPAGSLTSPTWSSTVTPTASFTDPYSFDFDGDDDYLDVGSIDLQSANKFTLSAWIRPDIAPQGIGIIGERFADNSTNIAYEIGFNINAASGDSRLDIGFYYSGSWRIVSDSTDTVAADAWTHIAGTWDGTNLILYRNGNQVNTGTPSGSIPASDENTMIGRRHDDANTEFFNGLIDDARIYNRALTGAEVTALAGGNNEYTALSSLDVDSNLDVTAGTFDWGGLTAAIDGNLTMGTGSQIVSDTDAMSGAAITVGGVLDLDGEDGDKLTFNWVEAWSLDVTGNADLDYVSLATTGSNEMTLNVGGATATASNTDTEYSNASGGTQINAEDGTNTDNSNNTNWTFEASTPDPDPDPDPTPPSGGGRGSGRGSPKPKPPDDDPRVKPTNKPPEVDAGPSKTVIVLTLTVLDATVTDDGNPVHGTLTMNWKVIKGPGDVVFDDPTLEDVTVTFSEIGTYILRLTASDGQKNKKSEVQITVEEEVEPPEEPTNTAPVITSLLYDAEDRDLNVSGIQVYEEEVVTLFATHADADGDILYWAWWYSEDGNSAIEHLAGSGDVDRPSYMFQEGSAGSVYHWTISVTDGIETVQESVSFSVIAQPEPEPEPEPEPDPEPDPEEDPEEDPEDDDLETPEPEEGQVQEGGGKRGGTTSTGAFIPPWSDLDQDNLYSDAALELYQLGILMGDDKGTVRLNDRITRIESFALLLRALKLSPMRNGFFYFSDTKQDGWYAPLLRRGLFEGIIRGYGDGALRPARTISLAEAVKIITIGFNYSSPKDEEGSNPWYLPYISKGKGIGLIAKEREDYGNFLSRGEFVFLLRWIVRQEEVASL